MTAISRSYMWKMIWFGIIGTCDGTIYQLVVMVALEDFSYYNKYKSKITNYTSVANALGSFWIALWTYYFNSTNSFLYFLTIVALVSVIPVIWVITEGVYFLIENGKISEGLQVLRNIQLANNPDIIDTPNTRNEFLKTIDYPIKEIEQLKSPGLLDPFEREVTIKDSHKTYSLLTKEE